MLSTGLPLSLFAFLAAPTAPKLTLRPYFDGAGPEGGGGGNHGSGVPRALGQPCCCIRGEGVSGLLRLGYPLPWLLIVVVLGLGLRLNDGAGEVVGEALFAGVYCVLMAGARRVLVGEMPNSFAFGDWWAAGGGESPASVVSIVMEALFDAPRFFATWRSSHWSGTRVLWNDDRVSWVRRPSKDVS